jgi:hypothetical protein
VLGGHSGDGAVAGTQPYNPMQEVTMMWPFKSNRSTNGGSRQGAQPSRCPCFWPALFRGATRQFPNRPEHMTSDDAIEAIRQAARPRTKHNCCVSDKR